MIGDDASCFIIAEAGSNHGRDLDQALKLIEIAAEAGADSVKFQLFSADKLAVDTEDDITSLNQDKFGVYGETLYDLYKKMELPREWLPELKTYAEKCGIMFSATPFDEEAVDVLEEIEIPFYKIASFEMVHIPLIKYVAGKGKPIILSTGMATMEEIGDAVRAIKDSGNEQYALLHCSIEYPPRMEDVNLAAIDAIDKEFSCPVGYSDHTLGITVPVAAVARGAKIIEKHFTLDITLNGPDHSFALSPSELKEMVAAIRDTEAAVGVPVKKPAEAEMIYLKRGRRSLFATASIKQGDIITKESISVLRPGSGLMPKYLDEVVGRKAKVDIIKNDPITWDKVK